MNNHLEKLKVKTEIPYFKLSKVQENNLNVVEEPSFNRGAFLKTSSTSSNLLTHKNRLKELRSQPGYAKGAKLFRKCLVENHVRLPNFLNSEEDH